MPTETAPDAEATVRYILNSIQVAQVRPTPVFNRMEQVQYQLLIDPPMADPDSYFQ